MSDYSCRAGTDACRCTRYVATVPPFGRSAISVSTKCSCCRTTRIYLSPAANFVAVPVEHREVQLGRCERMHGDWHT